MKLRLTGRRRILIGPSRSSAGSPAVHLEFIQNQAGLAEAEDVHLVAGICKGVALTADARIARNDRVDDDRDAASARRLVSHP